MNDKEIMLLVNKLRQATIDKKISWERTMVSSHEGFRTVVDKCPILFGTYYNPLDDVSVADIELRNTAGATFFKGSFHSDTDTPLYIEIEMLQSIVIDQLFMVSDSKKRIFDKLDSLLNEN